MNAISVNLGCIKFDTSYKSYSDAVNYCTSQENSVLLEIKHQDQQDFVTNQAKAISTQVSWWLNLNRIQQSPYCIFQWVSNYGTPIYTPWATGQPVGPDYAYHSYNNIECNYLSGWYNVYMTRLIFKRQGT